MKLPIPVLDLPTALLEFDTWITPSLGEIRDTERFREELAKVAELFEVLETATHSFAAEKDCTPAALADTFSQLLSQTPLEQTQAMLEGLASILFLVTGKSDNNAKCQLPIYLRNNGWATLPNVKQIRGKKILLQNPIPRELKSSKLMGMIADLGLFQKEQQSSLFHTNEYGGYQKRLLEEFIGFILNDQVYISQLWSIGRSYFMLKPFQKERDLLSPLVVFQVRGSVSASGGHSPEELLRQRLAEWGMQAGIDYNLSDVIVTRMNGATVLIEHQEEPAEANEPTENKNTPQVRQKTRAYDFVLPYRTSGWQPALFIQSQFYAGDSGSVSHKNVDQTKTSRIAVQNIIPLPKFIEYVDGAGYFSSLNGDLKTLLSMETTTSFTQIRSAAIRLRREIQDIGFLMPLELEHAILRAESDPAITRQVLVAEGYSEHEIERCYQDCIHRGFVIVDSNGRLLISPERRATARRYLLLDIAARAGSAPTIGESRLTGSLMVPG